MAEADKPAVRAAAEIMAIPQVDGDTLPEYMVEPVDIDYKAMLRRFEDRASFVDGVRRAALSRTKPQHWLARRSGESVSYSLMSPGAERIKTLCPIGFTDIKRRKETWRREYGEGYTWIIEANVYLGTPKSGILPVVGSCDSAKEFFSVEHVSLPYNEGNQEHAEALESGEGRLSRDQKTLYIKRRIPASELDESLILKNALSNLCVNGVTRVLGIRAISEEELKEVGIDIAKVPTADYASTRKESGQLAPADEQKRADIRRMLTEMNGGDEKKALADLKAKTAFDTYTGCESWEKLSVKQIARKHPEIAAAYAKWRGDPPAAPAKGPEKAQRPTAKGGASQPPPSGPPEQKELLQ